MNEYEMPIMVDGIGIRGAESEHQPTIRDSPRRHEVMWHDRFGHKDEHAIDLKEHTE